MTGRRKEDGFRRSDQGRDPSLPFRDNRCVTCVILNEVKDLSQTAIMNYEFLIMN